MKAGETGRYSCSAKGMRSSFHERDCNIYMEENIMTTRELLDSIGPGITGALKAVDPV